MARSRPASRCSPAILHWLEGVRVLQQAAGGLSRIAIRAVGGAFHTFERAETALHRPSVRRTSDRRIIFDVGYSRHLAPGIAMDMDDADRFQRQAEICREESNKACSPVEAVSWLRLAEDFEKLAERDRGQGSAASAPLPSAPEVGPYIGTALDTRANPSEF